MPEKNQTMHFAVGITDEQDPQAAVEAVLRQVQAQLKKRSADCALLFVSSLYGIDWKPLLHHIQKKLRNPVLIGCTGGGILGKNKELEFEPALVLAAAHLPDVKCHPFIVRPQDLTEVKETGFWIEKLGCPPSQKPVGILLPDPYTCDVTTLIPALNAVYPHMPIIGGLASSARPENQPAIFMNDQEVEEGAVGLLLSGNIALQTVVSQGCRPIGRPFIITKAEENIILELAGLPATEALHQLFGTLSESDRSLAKRALMLGVVIDEQKDQFNRGDFLIRNLVGMDPESGSLAVGDRVDAGQTVQFQVRDADSSKEDLGLMLKEQAGALKKDPPAGALLFNCLGRGKELYGEEHYDIRTIQSAIGSKPIAGFFCNGEIGPVGKKNFIHGFTSSLGLFRPKNKP